MVQITGSVTSTSKKFHLVTVTLRGGQIETDDQGWAHHAYQATVHSKRTMRRMTTPYMTGTGWDRLPTADEVLDNLTSDARYADMPFEEWADELGFDSDSRKAEATWNACRKTARSLQRVLGDQYDAAMQIEEW